MSITKSNLTLAERDQDDEQVLATADDTEQLGQQRLYEPQVGESFDPYADDPAARASALAVLAAAGDVWAPHLSGEAKLALLLDLPQPAAVVQALAPDDFVWLVQDIGENEAPELLALASPRQLQALVDLAAWGDDELDSCALLRWMAVADEAGGDHAQRFVAAQEDGVLCLALAQHLTAIPNHPEVDAELPDDAEVFDSPDGGFKLIAHGDPGELALVRRLLAVLYDLEFLRARAVIKGLYWELPAQLADDVEQLRASRLAAQGFEPRAQALLIYAYRDPHQWRSQLQFIEQDAAHRVDRTADSGSMGPFGLALATARQPALLAQAVQQLSAADAARVQTAVMVLAHRAHSANASALGSVEELPAWTRHALCTLTMGLEHGSDGQVDKAAQLLQTLPLSDLFAVGHSLVVIAAHRARRLRIRLGGDNGVRLLPANDVQLLRNLVMRLPVVSDGQGVRPVESVAELRRVVDQLTAIEAMLAALLPTGLSLDLSALPAGTTLQQLLATALAWRALGQPPSPQPLDVAAVRALVGSCFERGHWRADLRLQLAQGPAAMQPLVEAALQAIESELGAVDSAQPIDLRFIGPVVLLKAS